MSNITSFIINPLLYGMPGNQIQRLQKIQNVADYLCKLISKNHSIKSLRSNGMMLLAEPKIRGTTYGPRSFVYAAPQWNKIPFYIKKKC